MADGSNIAKEYCEESALPEYKMSRIPYFDDFDGEELGNFYYAPRIMPTLISLNMWQKKTARWSRNIYSLHLEVRYKIMNICLLERNKIRTKE